MGRAELSRALKLLKAKGRQPPKPGYCVDLVGDSRRSLKALQRAINTAQEGGIPASQLEPKRVTLLCRDYYGYYLSGQFNHPTHRAAFDGFNGKYKRR